MCVGIARVGQPTQLVMSGPLKKLAEVDFGAPLHSLILCGDMHYLEEELLKGLTEDGKGKEEAKEE